MKRSNNHDLLPVPGVDTDWFLRRGSRQTLKIVISLLIMQHGVHLLLLLVGYRTDGSPPIVDSADAWVCWR
jgi:hypothetical protein